MSGLALIEARVARAGQVLLDSTSLAVRPGELVVLAGPNAAGKTTAVRALLGLEPLASGSAQLGGSDVRRLAPAERARRAAWLPQNRSFAWPLSVGRAVELGRYAWGGAGARPSVLDREAVDAALVACGLDALRHRAVDALSGGEQARVHLARVLAARTPAILADEPTGMLDPAQADATLDLLAARARDGAAVLVVLHDLVLAARKADRVILMQGGRVVADGAPRDALAPERLAEVFAIASSWTGGRLELGPRLVPPGRP